MPSPQQLQTQRRGAERYRYTSYIIAGVGTATIVGLTILIGFTKVDVPVWLVGALTVAIVGAAYQSLNLNREAEQQLTEPFTRAIDQLGATDDRGNKRIEVRLGGIYALERIARDSPDQYYRIIMDILTAYVRENAPWPPKSSTEFLTPSDTVTNGATDGDERIEQNAAPKRRTPPTDIQAILDVLSRREKDQLPTEYWPALDLQRTDLSGTSLSGADLSEARLSECNLSAADLFEADLSGADLSGTDLSRAHLSKARLSGARLTNTRLSEADLSKADLSRADLLGADLSGADIFGARLSGARLSEADLSRADLSRADLSAAVGLTQEQVNKADGDATTTLPKGHLAPAAWSRSTDRQTSEDEK